MNIILGIDPGSRITGYGVIKTDNTKHHYVTSGCIRVTEKDLSLRLQQIFDGVRHIIFQYQPHEVAIEQVFVDKNVAGALKLGQARGVAIVTAAIHTLPVSEYSARQIKQSVVGYGAATKSQVQHMVQALLNLSDLPQSDAADALAVALCHAHARNLKGQLAGYKITRRGRRRDRSNYRNLNIKTSTSSTD